MHVNWGCVEPSMSQFNSLNFSSCRAISAMPATRIAFMGRTATGSSSFITVHKNAASCTCPTCSVRCVSSLFAEVAEETEAPVIEDEVPAAVAAMDGVENEDEAHNVDRPARQQLRKKKTKGKELSEFEVGSTVSGTVRSITSYGAFVDIGATTDGLLHISQLSTEYVGDVKDIVKEGQELQVRIVNIDSAKGQVGLSLMTAAEEASSQQAAQGAREARQARSERKQNNTRRDDSSVLSSLKQKGWDSSTMVEGTVVSIVDFGCFVRLDASALNSDCEGEFDGLVHISALRSGRVGSVADVVSPDDKVQVRVKSIDGNKVSLTMLSVDDESSKAEAVSERGFNEDGPGDGAANWKQLYVDISSEMPAFHNRPLVEDRRK